MVFIIYFASFDIFSNINSPVINRDCKKMDLLLTYTFKSFSDKFIQSKIIPPFKHLKRIEPTTLNIKSVTRRTEHEETTTF